MRLTHPVPRSPVTLALAISALALLAAPSSAQTSLVDIRSLADSALAQERRFYFLKCTGAMESRREHVSYGLKGMGLFLAAVPLEYAISRERHLEKAEPTVLNATAFVLMGFSLYHLCQSWRHYEDYERDRVCCRYWQEYAQAP